MFPDRMTAVKALTEYARQLGKDISFPEPPKAAFYSIDPYKEMVRVPYVLSEGGKKLARTVASFDLSRVEVTYSGTKRTVRNYELEAIFNKLLAQKGHGLTNGILDLILSELSGILEKQVCDVKRVLTFNEHGWVTEFQVYFNFTGIADTKENHCFIWTEEGNAFVLGLRGGDTLMNSSKDPRAVKLKEVLDRLVPLKTRKAPRRI